MSITEQPDALRLADFLDDCGIPVFIAEQAAAELRRLHAENKRLLKALEQVAAIRARGQA
jgi:Ca2+-dependent lipid-binding protein